MATAAIAVLLGSGSLRATTLAAGMLALQAAIGSLNDLVDAPRDADRGDKPIPAGLVAPAAAWRLAALTAGAGLVLSAATGWGTLLVGLMILGVGFAYDLWFKGTIWSWLPFAVGIPLLPVYAAVGAVGGLPAGFGVLVLAAVPAGAMLALGNALADLETDRRAGVASVATRLGPVRALLVQGGLLAGILALALSSLDPMAAMGGVLALAAGAGVTASALVAMVRPELRRIAWAGSAAGIALMGAGWVAARLVG